MEELLALVKEYCAARNLIEDTYIAAMLRGQPLDEHIISILVRYHKEWLK